MQKNAWWKWGFGSILLAGLTASTSAVTAQTTEGSLEFDQSIPPGLEQVTNVNQLRDVAPTDWAYEALRSLVDRYSDARSLAPFGDAGSHRCISGFPDRSYRGDRPLSRYEFAAGLNSCLNLIERLIVSQEFDNTDLDTVNRLAQEFAAELPGFEARIDSLENRAALLEDEQFSTTTKLKGQIVFGLTNAFGGDKAVPFNAETGSAGEIDNELVFDGRVRLNFDTSFTGKDLLKVRLDALNVERFGNAVTGTNMTRLAFDRPLNGDLKIGKLFYRFRPTDKLSLTVDATRGRYNANVSDNFNSLFANPVKGSVSNFGRFNPIYAQGAGGTGVTAVYQLSEAIAFNAGYMARNANNPTSENGLFNGSFAALAQLDIAPADFLKVGLTYVRAYYPGGRAFVSAGTGSRLSNAPFGNLDTSANHFGLQTSLDFDSVVVSGWAGYTTATAQEAGVGVAADDGADILNWAATLAFLDLGGQGNVAGITVGQQPRVIDSDSGAEEDDANWHLQAQYRYKLSQGISLNPGIMAILNPENNADNDTIYVGTLRTIFEF